MTTTRPGPAFTVHPRCAGDPEPDLTGFRLIHRALRTGSRLIADTCNAVADGEPCSPERHDDLVWFATHVLREIHAHHQKEDDVLWPVIVASAGDHVDLEPLTDDHRALARALARADDLLGAFTADITAAADLAVVMTGIADELDEHIADEETTVFPIMRTYVSAGDFAKCEKQFQQGTSLRHLVFILPWVMAQCTTDERRGLMQEGPLPLRLLLRMSEGRWQRRVATIRG